MLYNVDRVYTCGGFVCVLVVVFFIVYVCVSVVMCVWKGLFFLG